MRRALLIMCLLAGLGACRSTALELSGLRAAAPLDYAVFVTGGTFLGGDEEGTFVGADERATGEPIEIDEVVEILRSGRVFRSLAADDDMERRLRVAAWAGGGEGDIGDVLRHARESGCDFLLVLEELRDGPIERQGINGRWPVTLATWVLLGVGALIPDHTFESRATLRVSIRDLQSGRLLYDPLLTGGPIDLALTERTDVLGLLTSILVPPFWVGDDDEVVRDSVRTVTRRRLLLQLARDLKSPSVRQRLRERSAASFSLGGDGSIEIDASAGLSAVRLRLDPPLTDAAADEFAAALFASVENVGGRFRYRARLPEGARGRLVQVLVATIDGEVASATLAPGVDS